MHGARHALATQGLGMGRTSHRALETLPGWKHAAGQHDCLHEPLLVARCISACIAFHLWLQWIACTPEPVLQMRREDPRQLDFSQQSNCLVALYRVERQRMPLLAHMAPYSPYTTWTPGAAC